MNAAAAVVFVLLAGQVHFPSDEPADPFAGKTEADALASLRSLEARLSLGQTAPPAEAAQLVAALHASPYTSVRALSGAVLAWLDPSTAQKPLVDALKDKEPRVRAVAAQSLLSLARRFDEEQRRDVVTAALAALDDPSDEVACAASELLGALSPSAAADAMRARADHADDVRYACFSRVAGLPTRAVELPPLPSLAPEKPEEPKKSPAPRPEKPAAPPDDGTWLFVGAAASAGLVAGGVLPSAFLPSRDVLLYTEARTKLTHEEVAFPSQAGAGLLGAAALGGGAYALSTFVRPLSLDEAGAVAIGAGALGLAGASSQLAFALREGPASFVIAGSLVAGVFGSAGLAYGFRLDADDEVLAASFAGVGALAAGTAVFAAVPVGLANVGGAQRIDFGLGVIGLGAGATSFFALASGAFLDVRPARSFAILAGAAAGGGLGLAGGFLLTPTSDVKSRIACGIGLGGELLGITAALLVPDDWLPHDVVPAVGTAVSVDGGKVALGIPLIVAVDDGVGATLVRARF